MDEIRNISVRLPITENEQSETQTGQLTPDDAFATGISEMPDLLEQGSGFPAKFEAPNLNAVSNDIAMDPVTIPDDASVGSPTLQAKETNHEYEKKLEELQQQKEKQGEDAFGDLGGFFGFEPKESATADGITKLITDDSPRKPPDSD